jgi:hypothetical protein
MRKTGLQIPPAREVMDYTFSSELRRLSALVQRLAGPGGACRELALDC